MNRKNTPKLRFKEFEKADPWEQRKLGELCERVTRKNKTGESDLPLTIASQYGLIDQRDFFNKVVAAKDMSNYYLLKKGEFAYNKSYSNGYDFGSIKRLNAYEHGCLSTLYICFGITSDDIESDYLECFFDTLKWYSDITMICAEGARNHGLLNVDTKAFFDEVTIEMPSSKEEQRKISSYLNNLDNLITLHQRKYEKLKKVKNAYLDEMFPKNGERFPKRRFPGFTDPWEQRKFSSVFEGLQNNTLSRAELNYESGTVKNVHYGDVLIKFGDYIDASEAELPYISDDAKADKFKNSFLQDGDIIIADTAEDDTVGKCTEIQGSKGLKLLSGLHTIACRPKEKYGPMFLGYYINSPAYHNQLKPLMQGIKVTSISKSALQDTDMIMPKSIDEQIKIGEYFSYLDNLITLHQRELDKLKKLKAAYLDAMFVGGK